MKRRDALVAADKALKAKLSSFQKESSVMEKAERSKQLQVLNKERQALQAKQVAYQQEVFAAQEKAMKDLMGQVKSKVLRWPRKKGMPL